MMHPNTASNLRIISANVVGLGNIQKYIEIMIHLEHLNPHVICMTDTRLCDRSEQRIRNNTDYTCFFNSKDSQSRGIAIFIKKNYPLKVTNIKKDNNGNVLCLECTFEDKKFVLAGIYGPNTDTPSFFNDLYDLVNSYNLDSHLICGDFNVTLNHEIDNRNYVQPRNTMSRQALKELMTANFTIDCYRACHGNKIFYTWKNWQGNKRARLDMFLASETLKPYLQDCGKYNEHKSDHNPIFLDIDFSKFQKGKGTWKFDNTLLKNQEYINLINKSIKTTCMKYLDMGDSSNFYEEALPHELELFYALEIEEIATFNFTIAPNLLYEMIMNDCRNETISFSTNSNAKSRNSEKLLLDEINRLISINTNGLLDIEIENKKNEYELALEGKSEKYLLNNKICNKIDGEKPTKFFCNLQKNFSAQKYIPRLVKNVNGIETTMTDQKQINSEIYDYFKELYSNKDSSIEIDSVELFLGEDNENIPKVSEDIANKIEGELTMNELSVALKKSNNDAAPGPNGFGAPFFKFFWSSIRHFLLNSANHSLTTEKLPDSLTQGIISLLPKGDKPKEYLKNWRPITLLNVDYKIISSAIAARISLGLDQIIHPDQCGFVPNRYIGESIRTTMDTLDYANNKKLTALLLILDFRKAFDSVSFRSILKSMSFLGYKSSIVKWVKTLLNNFKARINNAGNLSDYFNVERGARQGDPVASLLFIITIEILAIKIRKSKIIKGISIKNLEIRLALYADDSNIFLKYCPENLRNVMKILNNFYLFSGLEIQPEKSQCVVIGKVPTGNYKLCPELNLIWSQEFTSLGIKFTADLSKLHENYELKTEEIQKCANNWKYRYLSPYGSICIAKTLLLSKISHLAIVLPNLSKKEIKTLEDKIYRFIWKGNDKVARSDAKLPEYKGGLNTPDLYSSWNSFKITWIRRLQKNQTTSWAKLFTASLTDIDENLSIDVILTQKGNLELERIGKLLKNVFWKQCILAIKPLMLEVLNNYPEEIMISPIWGSDMFLKNNKPCSKEQFSPISNKITYPMDLIEHNGNGWQLLDDNALLCKLGQDFDHDKVIELRHLVTTALRIKSVNLYTIKLSLPSKPILLKTITAMEKGCSTWSKLLKRHHLKTGNIYEREVKWDSELGSVQGLTFWDRLYRFNKSISFDNRLKWLNFQISRGTLKTNRIIGKFVTGINEYCTFCSTQIESISHLFWNCTITTDFINNVYQQLKYWPSLKISAKKEFLFGITRDSAFSPMNFLNLYMKLFIWTTRCKKNRLSITGFLAYLKFEISVFIKCLTVYEQLGYLLDVLPNLP